MILNRREILKTAACLATAAAVPQITQGSVEPSSVVPEQLSLKFPLFCFHKSKRPVPGKMEQGWQIAGVRQCAVLHHYHSKKLGELSRVVYEQLYLAVVPILSPLMHDYFVREGDAFPLTLSFTVGPWPSRRRYADVLKNLSYVGHESAEQRQRFHHDLPDWTGGNSTLFFERGAERVVSPDPDGMQPAGSSMFYHTYIHATDYNSLSPVVVHADRIPLHKNGVVTV